LLSDGCPIVIRHFLYPKTILKLELDNIELNFNSKKILGGIYLYAETGKVTGILGRNGCGKTSLLRILFGSLNPKYGNVRLDGVHQKKKLFRTGKAAYLPQHRFLPKSMKIQEAFNVFGADWSVFVSQFESFNSYSQGKLKQLSSGELRLLETYLILHSNKKIILLDEPFSFIAPLYVDKIKTIINAKKMDSIIIVTDHFYEEILHISDSVYFLKDGSSRAIHSKIELEQEGYLVISE
jgi:ABC-type multidrug transport system ATPase subunit